MNNAYTQLERAFAQMYHIRAAQAMLHWDQAVMMPAGSSAVRGEQLVTLEALCHERMNAPQLVEWLDTAERNKNTLEPWQQRNLELMRHRWSHSCAVPSDLVEALARKGSECEMVWRTARHKSDWKSLEPHLKEILKLVREIAAAKAQALKLSPYDALLDQFDAGRRSAQVDPIFADLEVFLPQLISTITEQQRSRPLPNAPFGPFPVEAQRRLALMLMKHLGFDFNQGRVDMSAHPFCGGVPGDTRITTRYNPNEFTHALMGILHETGHALYEQNLPEAWRGQPIGDALGMTMHESQSLLVEMQVCRSRNFLMFAAPEIAKAFDSTDTEWSAENLHRIYNRVQPGLIRVDADEATYPLHIILRYRMEQQLIAGDMEVEDIPAAWNDAMKRYLGIEVPSHRDGCMQDIHWMDGSFGYFPTYTLGAMFAAQLYASARKQQPEIVPALRKGDFSPLTTWLKENIHSQGSLYTADALLERATGEKLSADIYKNHLKNRYLS